jgi:hypothetical protein
VAPLLNHRNATVRGDAINTVNLAVTADEAGIVAGAIERITDGERPVRYSAFQLLAATGREQLETSWHCIHDVDVEEALQSVLDKEHTVPSAEI